ncbi:MAG TPA: hypothetical protein PKM65_10685 [Spirochaetota bacterium]|mgnify:FL=1|nr:hypothetical protein [Spirochaetota bacterium]HNT09264.1 hypothetical protein [Spirochaetota bacterium]HNV46344.1 hypothetical protein [Spirochaetota bacterium]HPI22257.1 hypothetical protein [Spirochaetota bacterium]HPU89485.1 hypothetical protein [Spirochaetota bacterium]
MKPADIAAHAGALRDAVRRCRHLLIYIKGSPDPDVIASSFAVHALCAAEGVRATIVSITVVSLPQNEAMIRDLRIPIAFSRELPRLSSYDAYAVMDFQSAHIKGVSERLRCAIHIDHHDAVAEDLPVDFKLVSGAAGSVSTLVALMLEALAPPFDAPLMRRVATALTYGIQTDTDNYAHANDLDRRALAYLARHADPEEIRHIARIPLSEEVVRLMALAERERVVYKGWALAGIGFIDESRRDGIAIIADSMARDPEIAVVVVFAVVVREATRGLALNASIRAKDGSLDLTELIRRITPEGGGRAFKGAYQVNLDYFFSCPDRARLWEVVRATTLEALTQQRDAVGLIELKGVYKRIRRRLGNLWGGS